MLKEGFPPQATGVGNPPERAVSPLEREFARLSRGDILGETPFIDAQPPAVTLRVLRDSRVLSIPKWRLAAKLLHDVAFAARFYRVLAVLLADKQQAIVQRLGYGRLTYSRGWAGEIYFDGLAKAQIPPQVSFTRLSYRFREATVLTYWKVQRI